MRSFVQHGGAAFACDFSDAFAAFGARAREKAIEGETIGGETTDCGRDNERNWTRGCIHRVARSDGGGNEPFARITDCRSTRIGNDGDNSMLCEKRLHVGDGIVFGVLIRDNESFG